MTVEHPVWLPEWLALKVQAAYRSHTMDARLADEKFVKGTTVGVQWCPATRPGIRLSD